MCIRDRPPTVKPSWDRISARTCRRTATAASAAPPAVDYGFGPGGAPRPFARWANTPPRVPRPRPGPPTAATPAPAASSVPRCQYRRTATAQSLWELLSYDLRPLLATHRLHLPSWMPLAALLNCSSLIPSRVIHMPIEGNTSRLSRRATPQCVTSPSAGRRPCQPTFCRATLRTTNRLYRRMRIGAAQRKFSRNHGERFLAPGYACFTRAE